MGRKRRAAARTCMGRLPGLGRSKARAPPLRQAKAAGGRDRGTRDPASLGRTFRDLWAGGRVATGARTKSQLLRDGDGAVWRFASWGTGTTVRTISPRGGLSGGAMNSPGPSIFAHWAC